MIRYNGEVLPPNGEFSSSQLSDEEEDDDEDDDGLSGAQIVGIVVAAVVGIVLVALIVVSLLASCMPACWLAGEGLAASCFLVWLHGNTSRCCKVPTWAAGTKERSVVI